MRRLVAIVGMVLSCAGAHPPAAAPVATAPAPSPAVRPDPLPAAELRGIDWCNRAYPWYGGPLKSVLLGKDCTASHQEARNDAPGEHAAWTWRIESVRYDGDRKVALVTLEMFQRIGPASATYRRTYRFFREGRHIALVGADPVVRVDEAQGGARTP